MCGICGIALSSRSGSTMNVRALERMRDVLTHRGPDGSGLFIDGNVALGHRRLSIIDVAGGHQPMASDDGMMHITYNGEIYNHPELRATLEAEGHPYRTRCDTETVLRMYERDGARSPESLRGMFAYAIWDRRRAGGELFLARDRFGVKPLYYTLTADGSLYFASEIKAILAAGAVTPALNLPKLPEYLANHSTFGDDTLFEGVHRLAPGHTLRWRDGEVKIDRFWELSFQPSASEGGTRSDADYIAEYGQRFREAVRMRLMSDVPLGMFLSGGIDSASITAAMSQLVDGPIKTFSVAFAEREANELEYARLVADRYRTDHHEVVVTPADFFGAVPRMIWHEDEPMAHPSSVALNFVSRLAAERVKVVLTGEGSDETLGGYGRYRTTLFNLGIGRRYQSLLPERLRDVVRRGVESLPVKSRVRRKLVRTFLALPADLDTLYFDNFAVFSRARQDQMLSPAIRASLADADPYATVHRVQAQCDARTLLNLLLFVDTKTYLHELLMKQDQMSMAASIESRVPFLDHPLVEFAARLPDRMKIRGLTTKYVLRRAMADALPPEILSRGKMGFPVPVGSWFRGQYRRVLDEFVLGDRALARGLFEPAYLRGLVARHTAGDEDHSERLWSLVNFEVWQRMQFDGEPVEDIDLEVGGGRAAPSLPPLTTTTR